MSSINITITYDPLAADLYATDVAPYTVSAWFVDRVDGGVVTSEAHGINPAKLMKQVLEDLAQKRDDIENLCAPEWDVELSTDSEEYVR